MAHYRGHLWGGFIAFALVVMFAIPHYHPSAITMFEWLLFAIAGSLFPDVDIKSKGQYYFYRLVLLLFILLGLMHQYRTLAIISILSLTPLLVKHRGIFHQLWFVIAIPIAIWYFVSLQFPLLNGAVLMNVIFFIAGAISHLVLDKKIRFLPF